ncbi:hypothetical protein C8R43DRAFT_665022 [Mycena crocata]|nr:hypothetical protein C8R43DRAFT_665022 [Mycena crocata]
MLNNPSIARLLDSDLEEILDNLHLVLVSIQSIISASRFGPALALILDPQDWADLMEIKNSDMWTCVPATRSDDRELLLTLGVDVLLATQSRCPRNFRPFASKSRLAYKEPQNTMLIEWFQHRTDVVGECPAGYRLAKEAEQQNENQSAMMLSCAKLLSAVDSSRGVTATNRLGTNPDAELKSIGAIPLVFLFRSHSFLTNQQRQRRPRT